MTSSVLSAELSNYVHRKYLVGENIGKPCMQVKAIGEEKFGE